VKPDAERLEVRERLRRGIGAVERYHVNEASRIDEQPAIHEGPGEKRKGH